MNQYNNNKGKQNVTENQNFSNGFATTTKYFIEKENKYFHSLDTVQNYVFGSANRHDDFKSVWQDVGFSNFPQKKNYKKNKKNLKIYGSGFAFGSAGGGNVIDYLTTYENYSFDGAYEYLAKLYDLEFEEVEIKTSKTSFKPRTPQTNLPTTNNQNKAVQIDKEENKAYFESICKEFDLPLENPYFSICENGFNIAYTDLDGKPVIDKLGRDFIRQRYFNPVQDKKGKTKKYNSLGGAGYFPYLTPLAHHTDVLNNSDTLYSIEGEKKALKAVLNGLAAIGIGGIHLGVDTEKEEYFDVNGNKKNRSLKHTAEFLPLTLELIKKYGITDYNLLFDRDTFENENDLQRALNFFIAIYKEVIAAKKAGITNFTFSCIAATAKAKGYDDLYSHYTAEEIKEKLEANTHHNNLFWHFRIDLSKDVDSALYGLKNAFIASSKTKEEFEENVKVLEFDTYLSEVFLNNSDFLNSLENNQFTEIHALQGGGKSYLQKFIAEKLQREKNVITLVVSPTNVLTKQQAGDDIYFNSENSEEANKQLAAAVKANKIPSTVFSNFDYMYSTYRKLQSLGLDILIIQDESQEAITGIPYRKSVISDVWQILNENKNNLLLSATPLPFPFQSNIFKAISNKPKHPLPHLFFANKNEEKAFLVKTIFNTVNENKRILIHLNSRKKIKAIQLLLNKANIKSSVFASKNLTAEEKEYFDKAVRNKTFEWKDDIQVIFATSCVESGFNIEVDRDTICLYCNKTPIGFDNISYRQFIGRIRNYTKFKISNLIITQNSSSFLPAEKLRENFDTSLYKETIEFYSNRVDRANEELEKLRLNGVDNKVIETRFKNGICAGVRICKKTNRYVLDMLTVLAEVQTHYQYNGSPYFENPHTITVLNDSDSSIEEIEEIKKAEEEVEKDYEKAENKVTDMFYNSFEILLSSIEEKSKNLSLVSQIAVNKPAEMPSKEENISLSFEEMEFAESLISNYLYLNRLSINKNNHLVKHILTDKTTLTKRKTTDLGLRKEAYQIYSLMLIRSGIDNDSYYKSNALTVNERLMIEEYNRIIEVIEKEYKGKQKNSSEEVDTLTADELVSKINFGRKHKDRYTKKKGLQIIFLLCDLEKQSVKRNGKTVRCFTKMSDSVRRDFNKAMNDLFSDIE